MQALAEAKEAWEKEKEQLIAETSVPPAADAVAATAAASQTAAATQPQQTPPTVSSEVASAAQAPADEASGASSDDPWIETIRCTTCNERTELNDRMFAYDEDMRAYIADLDAGSYRELVEAAETCQVAIIHPGKPRNPDEPGLEEFIERAESFNM